MKYFWAVVFLFAVVVCRQTPCEDSKQEDPYCETTGGHWVELDDGCLCDCPSGLKWLPGHGCQVPIHPCDNERLAWPECEATGGVWEVLSGEICDCRCPGGMHFEEDKGCVPDPPPPPPPEAYYTLARAGTLPADYTADCTGATGMVLDLCEQRQNLWHQGFKGPDFALLHCRNYLPVIGLDPAEIDHFASVGWDLIRETDRFITRLPMENENYPDRSVVRKDFYKPFQANLVAHLKRSEEHNAATQTDPCRKYHAYDGLQGWCEKCYLPGS